MRNAIGPPHNGGAGHLPGPSARSGAERRPARDLIAAAAARRTRPPEPWPMASSGVTRTGGLRAPYRPRNSPFTTFPLAFRGSSGTNSTSLGTL